MQDVTATSAWYQRVLGLTSGHGGAEYERLLADNELVLQLHRWDAHDHANVGDPALQAYGNGVVLWFHDADVVEANGSRY